jgi:hypothetical protein
VDDYFAAVAMQRGFIPRSDVLLLGLDDRFIRRMLRTRTWTRVRKGAYCPTSVWELLDANERHRRLARAVLHSHGDAVVLSKVSGLLMREGCDVWGIDLSRVHVTRRDGRSGSIERDVIHHEGVVTDDDIDIVNGLLVLKEARCVVETIPRAGVERGLVLTDAALHAGRVSDEDLREAHDGSPPRQGNRTVDLTLRLTDGRAESVGESRARYAYWSQGLPRPEVQYHVYDDDGTLIGISDLGWPDHGLLFEFDGRIKYGRLLKPGQQPGDVVFEEKRREDALRRVSGFAVERATWQDLSAPALMARRARQRMWGHHSA